MTQDYRSLSVSVGDEIQTPFGVATVLHIDFLTETLRTTLGSWGREEVAPKLPPQDGEDVAAWLLGPRLEVRTTHDTTSVPCECSCGCSVYGMTHKLTKRKIFLEHLPAANLSGCMCSTRGCACLDVSG